MPEPDPKTPFFNREFSFNGSCCKLYDGVFDIMIADFLKALLFRSVAIDIAADAKFYYCHDCRFDLDWAFAKVPASSFFEPHPVWSRRSGQAWEFRANALMMEPH